MDHQKTYTVSIPSVALGMMACRLAMSRMFPGQPLDWMNAGYGLGDFMPTPRRYCCGRAGLEYYAIIDRISRGEAP